MNTLRIISDKSRYVVAALLVAFSIFVPVFVSADQLTQRSIELSSSTKSATNVTYGVEFTTPTAGAKTVVLEFCSNSPLIGQTCTVPTGMSASSATTATSGYSATGSTSRVTVTKTAAASAGDTLTFALTGITNPSAIGSLYTRILTYADGATAYTNATTLGSPSDQGSVALSITDGIAVSGDVLESLTFCVGKNTLTADCANAGSGNEPTLKLGENNGGVIALQPGVVSSGSLSTQISTNALNGAVVRLKSSATDCGGLVRAGAASNSAGCGILPALNTGVTTSSGARFGVKTNTGAAATGAANPTGVLQPFDAAGSPYYSNSAYALRYAAGNATGVTSVYGDQFLDTNGAPVNNQNMQLDFGATIANDTPAGSYSANLSLIATGKF